MSHLKHGADGHLLRSATGNLVHACAAAGCPCAGSLRCTYCPDATPTQFHVTFVGVAMCAGCVACADLGLSARMNDGSTLDGTYTLTQNGACAWTAFADAVAASANAYGSVDCSGAATPITFAIQQVRIDAGHFLLQVTDETNLLVLFNAIVPTSACCIGYTISNALACGCSADHSQLALASGGSATVTPC